ncbi:MAG: hypothetical protein IJ257_00590 [Treponema sp.]|nr:hypothetical protein [Treponema sp.]
MKKSLAKAGAFALALSLSLWLSSCSDDDSSSSPLSSENVVTLNELVIKANAYVAADKSLTDLEAKIAEAEKILESNDSDSEVQAAISSLDSLIEAAKSTKISDESFSDLAGSSKSRSYKGLFNPTILKEDYDSVWLNTSLLL